MKNPKAVAIIICVLGIILAQTWSSFSYHQKAESLKAQTAALKLQTEVLEKEQNSLPTPTAEAAQIALRQAGFTNVNCIVWGEKSGKTMGFMIHSNDIVVLPEMEIHMKRLESEGQVSRMKL